MCIVNVSICFKESHTEDTNWACYKQRSVDIDKFLWLHDSDIQCKGQICDETYHKQSAIKYSITSHEEEGKFCRWMGSFRNTIGALREIAKSGSYKANVAILSSDQSSGSKLSHMHSSFFLLWSSFHPCESEYCCMMYDHWTSFSDQQCLFAMERSVPKSQTKFHSLNIVVLVDSGMCSPSSCQVLNRAAASLLCNGASDMLYNASGHPCMTISEAFAFILAYKCM